MARPGMEPRTSDLRVRCPTDCGGWPGGAKVLGKLSVPGRPTSLDDSKVMAYCTCSRCGWGLFGHFFSHLYFLSPSL